MPDYNLDSLLNRRIKIIHFISLLKDKGILVYKSDICAYISYLLKINYYEVPLKLTTNIVIDDSIIYELKLLQKGYPLSYIIKNKYFYGHEFYIDERALIPREDTSIIVNKVLELNDKMAPTILDLCTGSGCIFITLLLEIKKAHAIGIDKSLRALEVAKINIERFGVQNRSCLICADVFNIESLLFSRTFDFITCNPPYVGVNDKYDNSILYEPREALFPNDKIGLIFYKKLLPIVNKLCRKGGFVIFEINPFLVNDIMNLLLINKIKANIDYDLGGNPRVVFWKNI